MLDMTVRTLITTITTGYILAGFLAVNSAAPAQARDSLPASGSAARVLSGLPLHFEPNKGQFDREVGYLPRSNSYTLFSPATGR